MHSLPVVWLHVELLPSLMVSRLSRFGTLNRALSSYWRSQLTVVGKNVDSSYKENCNQRKRLPDSTRVFSTASALYSEMKGLGGYSVVLEGQYVPYGFQ